LLVFTGFGTGIGQGIAASKAVEAVGRQPEASGKITTTMIIGQAVAETTGLYGLLIAFILINKLKKKDLKLMENSMNTFKKLLKIIHLKKIFVIYARTQIQTYFIATLCMLHHLKSNMVHI